MDSGMDSQDNKKTIKCVVVGDGASGKTCLLRHFKDKQSDMKSTPVTVCDDFGLDYTYESTVYTLSLFDTAGLEDFDRLRPLSYPDTDVILICYSLIDVISDSFLNVKSKWIPEVKHYCPQTPIVLVGTKLDLREGESTLVGSDEANIDPQIVGHIECSSCTGEGVEEVFLMAVRAALKPRKRQKKKSCHLL